MVQQSSTRSGGTVTMSSSNPSAFRSVLNTGIRGLSGRLQSYGASSNTNHTQHHNNYSHASTSQPYQSIFSESLSVEKRLERYSYRLSQLRISQNDVQRVTNDPEQFVKLQESLRQQHCITDAYVRQTYYNLIRDRVKDMRPMPQQEQQIKKSTSNLHTNDNVKNERSISFIISKTEAGDSTSHLEKENHNNFDTVTASVTQSLSFDDDDSMDLQEIDSDYDDTNPAESVTTTGINTDKNYFLSDNPSPTSVTAITVPTNMILSSEKCITPTLLVDNSGTSGTTAHDNNFEEATTMERGNISIDSEDDDIQSAGDCNDIHMIAEEEEEDSDDDHNSNVEDITDRRNELIVSS